MNRNPEQLVAHKEYIPVMKKHGYEYDHEQSLMRSEEGGVYDIWRRSEHEGEDHGVNISAGYWNHVNHMNYDQQSEGNTPEHLDAHLTDIAKHTYNESTEEDDLLKKARLHVAGVQTTIDVQENLWDDQKKMAKTSNDPDILHVLSKHQSPTILLNVINNKHTRDETLQNLTKHKDGITASYAQETLTLRKKRLSEGTDDEVLKKAHLHIAGLKSSASARYGEGTNLLWDSQVDMAVDSKDPDILHQLSKHPSSTIRLHVTDNPHTHDDTLRHMSMHDEYYPVRDAAAAQLGMRLMRLATTKNESHDPLHKAQLHLADTADINDLYYMAHETPNQEVIKKLAGHEHNSIRWAVAANSNTPEHILRHIMTNDTHQQVRLSAARNLYSKKIITRDEYRPIWHASHGQNAVMYESEDDPLKKAQGVLNTGLHLVANVEHGKVLEKYGYKFSHEWSLAHPGQADVWLHKDGKFAITLKAPTVWNPNVEWEHEGIHDDTASHGVWGKSVKYLDHTLSKVHNLGKLSEAKDPALKAAQKKLLSDFEATRHLIHNPTTDGDTLHAAAEKWDDWYVRGNIPQHKNVQERTLKMIYDVGLKTDNNGLRYEVVNSRNTPLHMLKTMTKDPHWEVKGIAELRVKMHPDMPTSGQKSEHLNTNWRRLREGNEDDSIKKAQLHLAKGVKAPTHELDPESFRGPNIVMKDDLKIANGLAQHSIHPEVLHKLASHPHTMVKSAVAENPHTSPETLDHLSRDPKISLNVLYNENTSADTIRRMHQEVKEGYRTGTHTYRQARSVRYMMAAHPNTPHDILGEFIEEGGNIGDRAWNTKHKNDGQGMGRMVNEGQVADHEMKEVHAKLAVDPDIEVRKNLAKSRNAHPDILARLSLDNQFLADRKKLRESRESEDDVLHAAHRKVADNLIKDTGDFDNIMAAQRLSRGTTDPETLDKLANSTFGDSVIRGVVTNHATPKKTLQDFVQGADGYLSMLAKMTLKDKEYINESEEELLDKAKTHVAKTGDMDSAEDLIRSPDTGQDALHQIAIHPNTGMKWKGHFWGHIVDHDNVHPDTLHFISKNAGLPLAQAALDKYNRIKREGWGPYSPLREGTEDNLLKAAKKKILPTIPHTSPRCRYRAG